MTRIDLLNVLYDETRKATGELIMPVKPQEGDDAEQFRAAEVHRMRLPNSKAAKKKAPYIIHQVITSKDSRASGQHASSVAVVRSIFCVYNGNEEEGALNVADVLMCLRTALLRQRVIANRYTMRMPLEYLIYPDETAPFFIGEMMTTWELPTIKREVKL